MAEVRFLDFKLGDVIKVLYSNRWCEALWLLRSSRSSPNDVVRWRVLLLPGPGLDEPYEWAMFYIASWNVEGFVRPPTEDETLRMIAELLVSSEVT